RVALVLVVLPGLLLLVLVVEAGDAVPAVVAPVGPPGVTARPDRRQPDRAPDRARAGVRQVAQRRAHVPRAPRGRLRPEREGAGRGGHGGRGGRAAVAGGPLGGERAVRLPGARLGDLLGDDVHDPAQRAAPV